MLFDKFLSSFNQLVFGHAKILEPINSTINEVLRSEVFNSLNLHDGKDHSGYIGNLKNAGKVKYVFNTAIGSQYAEFEIHSPRFYNDNYWVRDLSANTVVRVKINLYKVEQSAINNWHGKYGRIDVASVSFDDKGNYTNAVEFELKAHFNRRHESDEIEVIVKGKADKTAFNGIFSKYGKSFKGVDFKHFTDFSWREVHSMNVNAAMNEQQKAYQEFINAKNQKSKTFENEKKQASSSNSKNQKNNNSKNSYNKENFYQESNNQKHDESPAAEDSFTSTDYYLILGVKENATIEEIKKSYRQKMMQTHPDKTDDPYLNQIAKKLNVSYEILSDAKKRKKYDEYLSSIKDNQSQR